MKYLRLRRRPTPLSVTALENRQLLNGDPTGTWLGQDGHDLVSPSSLVAPSGVQDIHLALANLPAGRTITWAAVRPLGGGEWLYNGPWGPWAADVVQAPGAATADVYVEPYQVESGRPFEVALQYDDGSTGDVWISGGAADPALRMPQNSVQAQWLGQDGSDRVGPGPAVGPDGVQDVHLVLTNLTGTEPISSVAIHGPGSLAWSSGTNPQGLGNAELIRRPNDPTTADLYFQSSGDLAGASLRLDVTYANGQADGTTVAGQHTDPGLAVAPPAAAPTMRTGATGRWLGQDGLNLSGKGDVHLALSGLPAGRTIVAAAVSDEASTLWAWQQSGSTPFFTDPFPGALGVRRGADPTTADLGFGPVRDESGASLTVRLQFDDGSIAVTQIAGGAADPGLRADGPAATSIVAQPGDDLNDLANRFGTVHLTAGTYNLDRPLVLNQPVNLTADPGATLLFAQGASEPDWTAAIKINAGHTHLDNFAVRFAAPVRWNTSVSYGPAVIGTTDDLDTGPNPLKVDIELTRLDLQSPPVDSGWVEAPRLIRLATAQSGKIEGNTLRGGVTEFVGGPWSIANNNYLGTVPNTFTYAVFGGHRTHDVTVQGNQASPGAGSGKTWRFLVLTDYGSGDVVQDNNVAGIGPKDSDTVHDNAPEIILTESYGLRFEGKPAAVSADGMILQVPTPQGGPARTGDVVAILDGPDAGRYVRVAQAINATTYLLDAPLPSGVGTISIAAGGFVGEVFQRNTIDARGSSSSVSMLLAGNHFGTQVLNNTFLGGGTSFLVQAAPSETPVEWGWSHAPMLGLTIAGNTQQDVLNGGLLSVAHGSQVKSDAGRAYMTATLTGNTTVWTAPFLAAHPTPPALTLGEPGSIDPGELVVNQSNNRVKVPAGSNFGPALVVRSATVNGQAIVGQLFALGSVAPPAPTGLALVHDSGASATDGITNDGRLRFNLVPGASGYEYATSASGPFAAIADPSAFLPAGLAQGANTIYVRAFDDAGDHGDSASIAFTYDTTPPAAAAPVLVAASDTGRSTVDRVTRDTAPTFSVSADPTDAVTLQRYGATPASRVGPGTLKGAAVPGDGLYYYFISRTDLAGNTSVSPAVGVVIDTTPPAAVTGLSTLQDGRIQFRPTSPDDTYEYRVGAAATYTPLGFDTAFRPESLGPGLSAIVFVRAVDRAGNAGPDAAINVVNPDPTRGAWLGQDGTDRASKSPVVAPDGYQDVHIALAGLDPAHAISSVIIQGLGAGQWAYGGGSNVWAADLVRPAGSKTADLYFQPSQKETGRLFFLTIRYDDSSSALVLVNGGAADPTLRAPGRVGVPAGNSSGGTGLLSAASVGRIDTAQITNGSAPTAPAQPSAPPAVNAGGRRWLAAGTTHGVAHPTAHARPVRKVAPRPAPHRHR